MSNNKPKGLVSRILDRAGRAIEKTAALPTVTIGLVTPDYVPADFLTSMMALCAMPGARIALAPRITDPNFPLSVLRNDIVEEALAQGTDFVFFMNHDLAMPGNTLSQLLDWGDRDIVAAVFRNKYPPYNLICGSDSRKFVPDGITEMQTVTMGCTLIKAEVFRKMERPWFREVLERSDKGDRIVPDFEDFCARARLAGFKVWADITLSKGCGRVGKNIFMAETDYGQPRQAGPGAEPHPPV